MTMYVPYYEELEFIRTIDTVLFSSKPGLTSQNEYADISCTPSLTTDFNVPLMSTEVSC